MFNREEALSPPKILSPGHFGWTGEHSLETFIGTNTASYFCFATRVIKRRLKGVAGAGAVKRRRGKLNGAGVVRTP